MKELSIEEKAKRYDEAINTIRNLVKAGLIYEDAAIQVIPELKESGDEKIRKALLEMVHDTTDDELWIGYDVHKEDALAWLEKQGNLMKALQISNAKIGELIEKNYYLKEQLERQGEQKPILDVEIPFGAKDSELQEVSYYIPEGFHAEIESNRVVIKRGKQKPVEEYNITGIGSKNAQGKLGKMIKNLKPVNEVLEHTDKAEPKFNVGDWIVKNDDSPIHIDYSCCKITKVENGNYTIESIYGYKGYNTFETFEKDYHLWTIQDAKDGDVLACGNDIVIFKENSYNPKDKSGCMFVYCSCNSFYEIGGINPTDYKPATKEQRELLFQKMHEAGYEWDAEKKKLTKVEQSPIDVRTTGYWHVEDVEQSPAWSEENEKILNLIIARLHSHPNVEAEEYDKDYHWLKSLKERFTWKPDELQLECLSDAISNYNKRGYEAPILKELLEQLKKLRDDKD